MKSRFIIEVETEDMSEVRENEDGTGADITKDVEKDLHEEIKNRVQDSLEKKDGRIFDSIEEEILEFGNMTVEGFESLEDYGKVTIKVIEEKK